MVRNSKPSQRLWATDRLLVNQRTSTTSSVSLSPPPQIKPRSFFIVYIVFENRNIFEIWKKNLKRQTLFETPPKQFEFQKLAKREHFLNLGKNFENRTFIESLNMFLKSMSACLGPTGARPERCRLLVRPRPKIFSFYFLGFLLFFVNSFFFFLNFIFLSKT
jgi:hypothetical protein